MSKQSPHSFHIEDAKEYGVECAVLLFNIRYWLDKNKANDKHIHDGRVWTYNSTKAFAELFPYLSEKQIYRRLKKLEEAGILITGNYNKNSYDQTKWYTVDETEYCISQDQKDQFPKSENGNSESGEPIPDINTDSKPNSESTPSHIPTLQEVKDYFTENGYDPKVAEKAYRIYNASVEDHPRRQYWRDSRDNKIKNWKLKMQSVWFKPENEITQNTKPKMQFA